MLLTRVKVNNINASDDLDADEEVQCNNINAKVNFKGQRPTNHSPPPHHMEETATTQNKTTCKACLETGHLAYQCNNPEAYKNYCYKRDRYNSNRSNQFNRNRNNRNYYGSNTSQNQDSNRGYQVNHNQDRNRSKDRDFFRNGSRSHSNHQSSNPNTDGKPDAYCKDTSTGPKTANVNNLQASANSGASNIRQ